MTEPNLFQEVQEDMERQRLEALWKNYGIWVIILATCVIGATAGTSAYRSWKTDNNQRATSELVAASTYDDDNKKTFKDLQAFAASHPGTDLSELALLRAGAQAGDDNDRVKAAQIFDSVAQNVKADKALRELGALLSIQTQLDSGVPSDLSKRLDPLMADGEPWRFSAMETASYLAIRQGDRAKARQLLTELTQDATVPETLSARASDLLRSLSK